MKRKIPLAALLVGILLSFGSVKGTFYVSAEGEEITQPTQEQEEPKGFVFTKEGVTYYKKNGKQIKKKFLTVEEETFYEKKNGKRITVKPGKYYFNKKGYMIKDTSMVKKGNLYIFDKTGLVVRTVYGKKKMVALTYDDGPSAYTDSILQTLKKYDGRATFFVIGSNVVNYKKQVKAASKMGCEIGNHTFHHTFLTRTTKENRQKEVGKTNELVKKITGKEVELLRAPGGCMNTSVAKELHMPVILWNVDTRDWETRDTNAVITAVLGHVSDGDIILMHDLYKTTAAAAQTIIPKLTKEGYQLVTVSEMAQLRGGEKPGKIIYSFPR